MSSQAAIGIRDLLELRPVAGAHRVALRAGISVLVPLLVVVALGHPEWSAYAAFAAFTSLYGRNSVHLSRAVMQLTAGTALTLALLLGVVVGTLPHRSWVAVGLVGVVAAGGTLLATAQDWHPPGPLFLVFAFGAVASVPHSLADLQVAAPVAVLTVLFAVVVGNAGAFLGSGPRSEPARLRSPWSWAPVRYGVAAVVAGSIATAVGIGHPYWATVAAVAPLSAPDTAHRLLRAAHRIVGTLLGLGTAAALLALHLPPVGIVLVVAALQIATEFVVGRNYGFALLFITPLALLMGELALPRPMGSLLVDRGLETAIGACLAVLVIGGEALLRRRAAVHA
jgi:uncharacterized membrane protein YccC